MTRLVKYSLLILFLTIKVAAQDPWYSQSWLNLMFYETRSKNTYQSIEDSSTYFLTPNGKQDPKAEYLAALQKTRAQDLTFKRTFPLRYKRLAYAHQIKYQPVIDSDPNITSVTLSYPSRYMGNPSSLFGHLFLIFEKETGRLDSTIFHFIADSENTAGLNFIYSGLTGQFEGRYQREPFHKTIKKYSYEDDREIIYYPLNLTDQEIEELQLLAIDLQSASFYYSFKDENCAFFIGKPLNIVLDEPIVHLGAYVAPSDIINTLIQKNRIHSKKIRQSSNEHFSNSYLKLNLQEKKQVAQLSSTYVKDTSHFSTKALNSFLSISEYLLNNYQKKTDPVRHNRFVAYQQLKQLNQQNIRPTLIKRQAKPILSKKGSVNTKNNGSIQLDWSPLYFDNPFNELKTNRLNVIMPGIHIDSKQRINPTLSILDIANDELYNSFFGNASWRTKSFFIYDKSLFSDISFDYGYASPLFNLDFVSAFLGLQLSTFNTIEHLTLNDTSLYTTATITAKQKLHNNWHLSTAYQYRYRTDYFIQTLAYQWQDTTFKLDYIMIPNKSNITQVSLDFHF